MALVMVEGVASAALSTTTSTLARYKRHAELFGPEQVFETARTELGPRDLAHLAGFMRDLPPWRVRDGKGRLVEQDGWSRFRLCCHDRDWLIAELIADGEPDGFIANKLGVSRETLVRIRLGIEPKTASKSLQPRAARNSNRATGRTGCCPCCGLLFAQPTGKGRPRKYCCEEHRRAHQTELQRAGS